MPRPLSRAELFDQLVVERANRDASEHDKLGHGLHEKSDRRLAEILAPQEGDICLDVATASGNLAIALAKRVGPEGKVLAIDLAEGMLDFATRKARAHKVRNVEFIRMDAQHLEFEDNTFDVVVCGLAVFYFPDIEGALQEMRRVLKPGGKFGVSSADPENAFSPLSEPYMAGLRKASDKLGLNPPAYSDVAALTRRKDTLAGLIKQAGFERVEVNEENVPVRFNSFEDWWAYGRGSTWGEILLEQMIEDQRVDFQRAHRAEVEKLFGEEGVKTATPVLFGVAYKPKG
ncbi:MAG TPA: class I SAM-dependent methyltransferase [Chloroflexia bacterium]|nr:class I SAM-dependent methyltransferase [Chloroflexia bacterium]